MADIENKVENLEKRVAVLETAQAVDGVHRANIDNRLTKIESGQQWLIRIVVGSVISAFLAWVYSGGLSG